MTDQEEFSQRLVNNLPFVTAFFSLNVPAGLAVYWIVNNIITTGITLLVRNNFKDEEMSPEVALMMAEVDAPVVVKKVKGPSGSSELRKMAMLEDSKNGLGGALQAMDETIKQAERDAEDEDDDEVRKVQ